MHHSVMAYVMRVLTAEHVAGKRVLEVGSYNVNGTVRHYLTGLQPAEYLGVDTAAGPDVDRVVNCEQLVATVGDDWDVVISTEMLEHVENWRECLAQMAAAVTPGGLLVITTRSPGFPYHPYPIDCWRYTPDMMAHAFKALELSALIEEDVPAEPGVLIMASKPVSWPLSAKEACEALAGIEAVAM